MDLIKLSRMRMAELQTVCGSSIKLCEPIQQLTPLVSDVKLLYSDFKQGMQTENASAAKKQITDKTRDKYLSGFNFHVKAESFYPHISEQADAITKVVKVMENYSSKQVRRLGFDEETATLDNMLSELKLLKLDSLENTGLLRWITLLENANEDARKAGIEYVKDKTIDKELDSATKQAPELITKLEALYAMLFALVKLNPENKDLHSTYKQLIELVNTYK